MTGPSTQSGISGFALRRLGSDQAEERLDARQELLVVGQTAKGVLERPAHRVEPPTSTPRSRLTRISWIREWAWKRVFRIPYVTLYRGVRA